MFVSLAVASGPVPATASSLSKACWALSSCCDWMKNRSATVAAFSASTPDAATASPEERTVQPPQEGCSSSFAARAWSPSSIAIWQRASPPATVTGLTPAVGTAARPASRLSMARPFQAARASAVGRTSSGSRRRSTTSRHSAPPALRSTSAPLAVSRGTSPMIFTSRSASCDSAAEATAICAASALSGSFGQVRMISAATSAHRVLAAARHGAGPSRPSCCQLAIAIFADCRAPFALG